MSVNRRMLTSVVTAVLMMVAVPAFGWFATTTYSPASQSVEEGETFTLNVNWSVAFNADPTIGAEFWFSFDPNVVQANSVTAGSAPFTSNVTVNNIDNNAGTIHFKANGGGVNSGSYVVATIEFEGLSAGTSQLYATNVNQYFQAYGVVGVNGGNSTQASVEITPGADPITELGRTSWEMHAGLEVTPSNPYGVVPVTWSHPYQHGHPDMYTAAVIPGETDGGWGPAPNGDIIGFGSGTASVIDDAGYGCWAAVDYTYFQTFVSIPSDAVVNTFTISFSGMDDGSRITMYNSNYPSGLVIPGSYVYLGATATSDLSQYVAYGEVNRVVITQVDDCPVGNNLASAQVVLNGETVEVACEPTEQTFTIFGANGSIGDIDPYSQSLPAGATEWQPVYLTGSHPWGYIPGTNSWVNFDPDNSVGINTRTPYRIRFEVPEDFTNASMTFNIKADNRAIIWVNDTFIDSVDGQGSPSIDATIADQALHPGLNEIRLTMVDWGSIVGFNYRIDVTMTSCEDIADAVLTPDEAAELNNPPVADAGPDQNSDQSDVTLDGSGSSDPDANLLSYSWSINGSEIATGVNPTVNLADGTYTITLTVSDGELSDTDDVVIVVATNTPPVADAGADASIDCVIEETEVTLDGSGSSDEDGDDLSYSWSYGGNVVSTAASFSTSLGGGDHTFTLTVSDGEASDSDDVTISVELDTEAPSLSVPEDFTVSNEPGTCAATVEYAATASDNCSDVTLTYSPASGSELEVGAHEVTVTATDAAGNSASDSFTVTVIDDEAPELAGLGDAIILWPPNHHYVAFDVTDFVASVNDNCSDLDAASVSITHVTSDEEEDARGRGDGHTDDDILFGDDGTLNLRAERQGGGNGRVYTIYLAVSDEYGNVSNASAQVHVPHNRKRAAIDDGAVYTVNAPEGLARSIAGGEQQDDLVVAPEAYALDQNYPNPFNPSTTINFDMPDAGHVSLIVYDVRGKVVKQLVNEYRSMGVHTVSFNASDLPAGTYMYVLETNGERYVKRMSLLK